MDSEDEDFFYDEDDEASDELDDDYLGDDIDSSEPAAKRSYDDDFQYECLTPESIVSTMNRSIDDVNNVFQVSFVFPLGPLQRQVNNRPRTLFANSSMAFGQTFLFRLIRFLLIIHKKLYR